ncbi:MAG: hypothetical protein AAF456_16455 [Planctomycetota bacterium]
MARIFSFLAAILLCFTGTLHAQWSDNFDSYANGTNVNGVNGWENWDNDPSFNAFVLNTQSSSAPNAIGINPSSDVIHRMGNPTSGKWELTCDQYIPGSATGQQYFIMLNTYNAGAGGAKSWSIQLLFDNDTGMLTDDYDGGWGGASIVYDQWVELRFIIDLDNDTVDQYYDGTLINSGQSWTQRNGGAAGAAEIGCVDLFSNGGSICYYDNLLLLPADPAIVAPETTLVVHGSTNSGGVDSLAESDNVDLSISRAPNDLQSRTTFIAKATSPTQTPFQFDVTVEGSVFSRVAVTQNIELFNYDTGGWELVDSRAAARFGDSTVTVMPGGDLSRFVEPGTGCIETRLRFVGAAQRAIFSSNTDQVIWAIR